MSAEAKAKALAEYATSSDFTSMAMAWFDEQIKIAEDDHFFAVFDRYPVRPGHALVVAKRVLAVNYLNLDPAEIAALHSMIQKTVARLTEDFKPDGYNIGTNVGPAANQIVWRFHMHVIPRYEGDKDKLRFEEEISQARVV